MTVQSYPGYDAAASAQALMEVGITQCWIGQVDTEIVQICKLLVSCESFNDIGKLVISLARHLVHRSDALVRLRRITHVEGQTVQQK